MATLSQAKTIGGVGSILIFIPFISLVGWILVLVAVRDLSADLSDKTILRNFAIAAAMGIVAALALGFGVFLGIMTAPATLGTSTFAGILGGLFLAWIFLIISAVFLRMSYSSIGRELEVSMFRTSATVYLVGAALTVIGIGLLLLFVAELLQAVAFFSIPDRSPRAGAVPTAPVAGGPPVAAPAAAANGSAKFCTNCGTKISPTATFCYSCGAKQS